MPKKPSALTGWKTIEDVPAMRKPKTSWAAKAIDEFLASNDTQIAREYKDDKSIKSDQNKLRTYIYGNPDIKDKVKVSKRGMLLILSKK